MVCLDFLESWYPRRTVEKSVQLFSLYEKAMKINDFWRKMMRIVPKSLKSFLNRSEIVPKSFRKIKKNNDFWRMWVNEWLREAENQNPGNRRFLVKKTLQHKNLHNSSRSAWIALKTCGIERSRIFTSKLYSDFFQIRKKNSFLIEKIFGKKSRLFENK